MAGAGVTGRFVPEYRARAEHAAGIDLVGVGGGVDSNGLRAKSKLSREWCWP